MLMGSYQNQIDAKNRVIIPAKFREELGKVCILTKGLDQCLVLYPLDTWKKQQQGLEELPRSDERVRAFLRYTYANARDLEMDNQGRILVSQDMKDFAHIEKELVTIGMIDRIEIWAKDVYETNKNGGMLTSGDLNSFYKDYKV